MTISRNVYNQLFEQAPDASEGSKEKVIRLRPTEAKAGAVVMSAKSKIQMWTKEEHERFLAALEKFPAGPWKKVADYIGTKTPRQTMTHAQKYRQKIHRRQRGLRNQKKSAKKDSNIVNVSSSESPTPVNIRADLTGEPKSIVSPYGVADLQLKLGSGAALAAAASATNDQLLNILAQQATSINDKPKPMQVDTASVDMVSVDPILSDVAAVATAEGNQSPNNNLPSLAEILHLGVAEGQAVEAEKAELSTKNDANAAAATKTATTVDTAQTRPEDCKCNCNCGMHGGKAAQDNAVAQIEEI